MPDVLIEDIHPSGDGIAYVDGAPILLPFTIPGERVRLTNDHRNGVSSPPAVIAPSAHRVTPRCPHFGPCGGCSWQHIAYAEQLRLKTRLVDRLVHAVVPSAPPVRPTLSPHADSEGITSESHAPKHEPGAPWGYRQKVHFVFANGARSTERRGRAASGGLVMGHYARGTRQVVPVRECPVHDERGNAVAFALKAALDASHVAAAAPATSARQRGSRSSGVLRSLAIRVGLASGERMMTLVVTDDSDRPLRTATRHLLNGDTAPTSIHVNLHPRQNAFIFGAETRRITGPARLRDQVNGASFLISPTAFFQTNVRAAALLVQLVLEAVPAGATVLDLYAGAGLFALPLARAGHIVVAVEENRAAAADGEASQRLNRIPDAQCRFVARPVEAALRELPSADVVVLDPPREGCAAIVLDALCQRMRPGRVVYVSCSPEALARDLDALVRGGYAIDALQPVDMFPHTAHVETVAVLTRR